MLKYHLSIATQSDFKIGTPAHSLCEYKKVDIIEGAVCVDHIHICVSISPKISVSEFVGYLKGKSVLMIIDKHPEQGSKWSRAFWARGYYVSSIGNITEEAKRRNRKKASLRGRW